MPHIRSRKGNHPVKWCRRLKLAASVQMMSPLPVFQLGLIAAVAVLGIAPPANGDILVISIIPAPPEESLIWALPAGALPMGRGGLRGSIIVRGSRSALLWPALSHGALLLNTRVGGCFAVKETVND
jgi:hypothetical protein